MNNLIDILIVDDNSANLNLLANILGEAGYNVRPANNGELALRSVKAKLPNLILLDIKMPGLDGYEVCQKLKADEKTSAIPVIFISALDAESDRIKCFKVGGVDYIPKPFFSEEILARVNTHLSQQKLQTELESAMNQYANLYSFAPVGYVTIIDGLIMNINQKGVELLGMETSDLTNLPFKEFISPDHQNAFVSYLEKVLLSSKKESLEFMFLRNRREQIYLQVEANCSPDREKIFLAMIDISERKKGELQLRESEERLKFVLEGSQLGFWDWNIETNVVTRNKYWAEMLGFTLEEIEFNVKQWSDLQHPEDRNAAWKSIQDHLEGRSKIHRLEYRMRTKSGDYKWILDQARIVRRDLAGKPIRMSGTHTDITELKRVEIELRRSEQKWRMLMASNPDYISIIDHKGGFKFENRFFGRSSENTVNERTVNNFLDPEYLPLFQQRIAETLATGKMQKFEHKLLVTLQDRREYEDYLIPLFEGMEDKDILIISRDITERNHSIEKLRESEEKYRQLFENSLDAVLLINANGTVDIANQVAFQMFGLNEGEVKQVGWRAIFDTSDPRFENALRVHRLAGKFKGELTGIHMNGSRFQIEITSSNFLDQNNNHKISLVIRDLSERIQSENDLQSALKKLRLISSRLAEITESERREIARELHDRVGQSLTALGINLSIVKNVLVRDELKEVLPRFDSAINLVAEITAEIRTLISNLHPPVLEDYGLAAALNWYVDTLGQQTGLQIQIIGEETVPRISQSVAMALYRIAQEALVNVLKHANTDHAIVRLEEKSDEIVLTIEDKGQGFDPLNITIQENIHWGINIMGERARAVGGFFEIKSSPNMGTTVCVRIPR